MGGAGCRLLYQEDSYLKTFQARIVAVPDEHSLILDQTAFHPRPSGGLSNDTGILEAEDGRVLHVDDVTVSEHGCPVHHTREPHGLKPGDTVRGRIDWERRYRMMRLHTASHIIAALLYNKYGALVTGGNIEPDKARDDFDLTSAGPKWREALEWAVSEANRVAAECHPVIVRWVSREEALRIPGLVKLAERAPPEVERLRIVEIPGVDVQADGAPHVRNTCEIGEIVLLRIESKGRRKRRLYYTVKP
ncbi:MAG: alanyl-tRNA editing protein [Desulfurococcales archaeon]|nr:alanyl-tRNA editing protein [Desulfurococcales archaeon]